MVRCKIPRPKGKVKLTFEEKQNEKQWQACMKNSRLKHQDKGNLEIESIKYNKPLIYLRTQIRYIQYSLFIEICQNTQNTIVGKYIHVYKWLSKLTNSILRPVIIQGTNDEHPVYAVAVAFSI